MTLYFFDVMDDVKPARRMESERNFPTGMLFRTKPSHLSQGTAYPTARIGPLA